MQDPQTSRPMNRKLILVLDHDEQTGRQVVQAIQQETACQAMLATTLAETMSRIVQNRIEPTSVSPRRGKTEEKADEQCRSSRG